MPYRPTRYNRPRSFGSRLGNSTVARSRYATNLRGVATPVRRGPYLRGRYFKKTVYDRTGILGGTNADMRQMYRKRSMPKRKKRMWRSFVRKVNAIAEKELGTRTVLFNDTITQQYDNQNLQATLTLCLYSFNNGSLGYLNDLNVIGGLENTSNPTVNAGVTVDQTTKYMFQSAVLDITLRNTSQVQVSLGTFQPDPNCALELDIYEISMRGDSNDSGTSYANMTSVLGAYDSRDIGGTGPGIDMTGRGTTPWELPVPLSRFKIKIWKKTKYFIPAGQTITHQTRDPKRHVVRNGEMLAASGNDGWNKSGMTRILYLVYKAVPGVAVGSSVGTTTPRISLGVTRKYMYKFEGANEDRERYIQNTYTPGSNV